MISIYTLKQFISLYLAYIVIVKILSIIGIHYDYKDIVAKSPIARKHLIILLKVLWQNYITRINWLSYLRDVCLIA